MAVVWRKCAEIVGVSIIERRIRRPSDEMELV